MQFDDRQYVDIITRLTALDEGMRGMHRRQDITNGRIAKNEEKTIEIDKKLVSVDSSIQALQARDKAEDGKTERAQENRTYWSRMFLERVIWIVLILAGVVLTKLGIINLAIESIY